MTDLYAAAVDAADVEPDLEATTDTYAHFTDAPLPLIEVVDEEGERKLRLAPETADAVADRPGLPPRPLRPAPVRQVAAELAAGPGGSELYRRHGTSRQTKDRRPGSAQGLRQSRRAGRSIAHRRRGDGWVGCGRHDQTLFALAALLASPPPTTRRALSRGRDRISDSSRASRERSRRTRQAATPTICPISGGSCATSRWNSSTRTATTSIATSTWKVAFVVRIDARAMNTGQQYRSPLKEGDVRRCPDRTRPNRISPDTLTATAGLCGALAD